MDDGPSSVAAKTLKFNSNSVEHSLCSNCADCVLFVIFREETPM